MNYQKLSRIIVLAAAMLAGISSANAAPTAAVGNGNALNATATEPLLAFPEAAGWGRYALGARASSSPTVYHVTNLNDSGTGSLRDAVSQSNRIVVFDVSGVIKLSSRMVFKSNLYIAGQTAPGEGITLYGNGVSFSGANNIICRYLRVRMGKGGDSGKDCAGISNGTNMIFDHCSFSWGLDETFSINPDGKGDLGDITLQNCIVGQGLLTHSAGGLMQADHITLYRNFYCDNSTRNNKVKGINQYANNVVYNWQNGCYIMGGDSEGQSYCNIESNLFINGPAKGGSAFGGGNSNFHFYADDNWQDSNMDGKFDPVLMTTNGGGDRVSTPYDYPYLELYPGNELIEKNIPTVGASLPYRDQADCYMVEELKSLGTKGKLITYETSLPIGTPSDWAWWKGTKRTDTDGDGMPDEWETANGTDPNKADATVIASNGYLNIENYINSITKADRQYFLRQPITFELKKATTSTLTIGWRDYTDDEKGFAIEVKQKDNTWKEVGRTEADATSYTINGLDQATIYDVRIRAFGENGGEEAYSDYTTGTFTTRQVETGIIDIDTYEPDVTNSTEVAEGQKLLLTSDLILNYNIPTDISPASVVATGKGTIKVSGSAIAGTASMNKDGEGTLILSNSNKYTGATVIHDGVVEINTLKNGGQPSSIGSSIADPQNLILDGGTLRYTGNSTSTDRGARLMAPSTLEISNASATLTAGGRFEGTGNLTLDGEGTLAIADAANFFAYTGDLNLKGGTIYFTDVENACKAFGSLGKKVIMSGGTMRFAYKNEDYQTFTFPIVTTEGTTSTIKCPSHAYIKNPISGTGDLILEIPYLRTYINTSFQGFDGQLIVKGVPQSGSNILFMHNSSFNSPKLRVNLTGKTWMGAWETNAVNTIGGISGDAGTYLIGSSKKTNNFKCSWTVGGANSDETFKGIINDWSTSGSSYTGTTSIIKVGTGLWRLTGNNTYKGTTSVEGGTLIINGTHSGTGAVTVKNEGTTLKGTGSIAGKVTTSAGTIVEAGDTALYGNSLTFKGAVTLGSGTTVKMSLFKAEGSSLYRQNNVKFMSSLTIQDNVNLELDMTNVTSALDHGKYFTIFGYKPSSVTGKFAKIYPEKPAEGFEWDDSELYTTGKLYIIKEGSSRDEENPGGGEVTEPEGETKYGMVAFGNCKLGSYDNSGTNNMLTGAENDEAYGLKLVCTGNLAKPLSSAGTPKVTNFEYNGTTYTGSNGRTAIKMSNGAQETLFLPEGARATKITFVGFSPAYTTTTAEEARKAGNGYPRTCYWKEVAGTTFTAEQAEADHKIMQTWDDERDNPYVISFDLNNVPDCVTFTNAGEQQAVIILVEYHFGGTAGTGVVTGIDNATTTATTATEEAVYDLSGRRVKDTPRGIYIQQGRKFVTKSGRQ